MDDDPDVLQTTLSEGQERRIYQLIDLVGLRQLWVLRAFHYRESPKGDDYDINSARSSLHLVVGQHVRLKDQNNVYLGLVSISVFVHSEEPGLP
jgi:hypothetical protein